MLHFAAFLLVIIAARIPNGSGIKVNDIKVKEDIKKTPKLSFFEDNAICDASTFFLKDGILFSI
jgi:hypothetical protein